MKLEELPDGARIFVDANILIYHFSGTSLECQAFLQRCEFKQLEAFTGVHIVLEVAHRLMMLEALQKGLITGGQPARKLKEQPEIVKVLQAYNQPVQQIPRLQSPQQMPISITCQACTFISLRIFLKGDRTTADLSLSEYRGPCFCGLQVLAKP